MADRTSAHLFGRIFDYLAGDEKNPPDARAKAFAVDIWRLKEEMDCDFDHYQMDADDALVTLGLAVSGEDGMAYVGDEGGPVLPPLPKKRAGAW